MRVFVCHNRYQQPGGEDQVFEDEAALLESRGHDVIRVERRNEDIRGMGRWSIMRDTLWSVSAHADMAELVARYDPEVVHFHNTFPLLSPGSYYAARSRGAAVVQTIHNFRILCPNALLFRNGCVCEKCVGRLLAWPGILFGCYRGSRAASAAVAAMVGWHRLVGTWRNAVDLYIALSHHGRGRLLHGGLPAHKIVVKPNSLVSDPGPGSGDGGYALFVGRLSEEKGVRTLLQAWRQVGGRVKLRIVGDGPLSPQVRESLGPESGIEWLGHRPWPDVMRLMGAAMCLVVPSQWYEGFPRIIVESLALGTPVVASDMGAMAELVSDGRGGVRFAPGDAGELASRVIELHRDPQRTRDLRQQARREFVDRYTADANHRNLMIAYESAILTRGQEGRRLGARHGKSVLVDWAKTA